MNRPPITYNPNQPSRFRLAPVVLTVILFALVAVAVGVYVNRADANRSSSLSFSEQFTAYQDYIKKNINPLFDDIQDRLERQGLVAARKMREASGHKHLEIDRIMQEFEQSMNFRTYEIQLEQHVKKLDAMYDDMVAAAVRENRYKDLPKDPKNVPDMFKEVRSKTISGVREMVTKAAGSSY